jgi:hypothetical protein
MPCLSGQFDPALGILIQVGILAAGTAPDASQALGQLTPFTALVDTGASDTCITPGAARMLSIAPIGMRQMTSAHQTAPVNVYQVDLVILFGNQARAFQHHQVVEFAAPPASSFQVLIGRDIICRGVLTMSFDGHFSFSL